MNPDQLTFLSEEHLAKPSASPDSEAEWLMTVVTWPSNFFALLNACGPSGWFGRMCPASYPLDLTTRRISVTRRATYHLGTNGRWKITTKLMSVLISNHSLPAFENAGMGSDTEFWTLNFSEFHNDADVCSLSAILETGDLPSRYFLSAAACRGILRRAEKRGKTLPLPLLHALQIVAGMEKADNDQADTEPSLRR